MAQSIVMTRRTALAVATWTATAAAAIGVGTAAISVLGAGITDRSVKPMTAGEVKRALDAPYTPPAIVTPVPTHTATVTVSPRVTVTQQKTVPAVTRSLSSAGGSMVVRCTNNLAYLVSWSPALGFATVSTGRGPASEVTTVFQAGPVRISMTAACHGGTPVQVGGFRVGGHGGRGWPIPGIPNFPGIGEVHDPMN